MKPCSFLVQFIAQHGNHRNTSIRNKMAPEAKLVLFRTILLCRLNAHPPGWSMHSYVCRLFSRFNHFHWDNSSPDSPPVSSLESFCSRCSLSCSVYPLKGKLNFPFLFVNNDKEGYQRHQIVTTRQINFQGSSNAHSYHCVSSVCTEPEEK